MLAIRLGLGSLVYPVVCNGYQNACVCEYCEDRASRFERFERDGIYNTFLNRNVPVSTELAARLAKSDSQEYFNEE